MRRRCGIHADDSPLLLEPHSGRVPAEFVARMRSAPFWPAFEAVTHTLAYDGTIMGDTQSGRGVTTIPEA